MTVYCFMWFQSVALYALNSWASWVVVAANQRTAISKYHDTFTKWASEERSSTVLNRMQFGRFIYSSIILTEPRLPSTPPALINTW
jgi:hypothetical protein